MKIEAELCTLHVQIRLHRRNAVMLSPVHILTVKVPKMKKVEFATGQIQMRQLTMSPSYGSTLFALYKFIEFSI